MGVGAQRFSAGKETRYRLHRSLGGTPGRRVRKFWPPPGFDIRTVQPVASRYTRYAILAHSLITISSLKANQIEEMETEIIQAPRDGCDFSSDWDRWSSINNISP